MGQTYQIAAQAQYPVITLPAGYHSNGMPYGLGLMQTMWGEVELVRWASAIESAMKSTDGLALGIGRKRPEWRDYHSKALIAF